MRCRMTGYQHQPPLLIIRVLYKQDVASIARVRKGDVTLYDSSSIHPLTSGAQGTRTRVAFTVSPLV